MSNYLRSFTLFTDRYLYIIFLIIALIGGGIFIKLVPPLWGADEITHFSRVYQISHGGFRPHKLPGGDYGGLLPGNLINLNQQAFANIQRTTYDGATARQQLDKSVPYHNLLAANFNKGSDKYWDFTGAAAYSPIAYVAPLVGVKVSQLVKGNIGTTIYAARIATLLVYVGLVYLALFLLRKSISRWLVFVVALLPSAVFQASIINVDSFATGLAIVIFALYVRLWRVSPARSSRRLWAGLLVALLLAALVKPNYAVLALPLFIIKGQPFKLSHRLDMLCKLLAFSTVMVSVAIWAILSTGVSSAIKLYRGPQIAATINTSEQITFILHHPINFIAAFARIFITSNSQVLKQFFGALGWTYVNIPLLAILLAAIGLFLATFMRGEQRRAEPKSLAVSFTVMALLCIATIYGVFYLTYTPVGANTIFGIQGRYFLPLAPFLLYGIRELVGFRLAISRYSSALLFPAIAISSLLMSIAAYYAVIY